MEKMKLVGAVLVDQNKALDTLSHAMLLDKFPFKDFEVMN